MFTYWGTVVTWLYRGWKWISAERRSIISWLTVVNIDSSRTPQLHTATRDSYSRVPTLLLTKKSRTFPGFWSPRMFKYTEKNGIYLQYSECSPLQKIQHSTLYSSKQQSTQNGCYTTAACFPFEPLEKCMTFEDILPGLSRTLSFNFQDFPGPVIYRDFPGPGIFEKKIQDFPGGVVTLLLNRHWRRKSTSAH